MTLQYRNVIFTFIFRGKYNKLYYRKDLEMSQSIISSIVAFRDEKTVN